MVTMIPEFTYDGEKVKNAQVGWNWCESTMGVNCNANVIDATKCKAIAAATTTTTTAASATTKKPADSSTSGLSLIHI